MLKFHHAKAGKAVIAKMPVVMHQSVKLMQEKIRAMMPKLIAIERESIAQMPAAVGRR